MVRRSATDVIGSSSKRVYGVMHELQVELPLTILAQSETRSIVVEVVYMHVDYLSAEIEEFRVSGKWYRL